MDIAWLALYNESLVEWLENENRLDELCGSVAPGVRSRDCRDEKVKPRRLIVPLRAIPDEVATAVGEFVIQATPGEGLSAYYRSPTHAESVFVPDLFDEDWGYGPFFHQTVLERQGNWFRLPLPFSYPAWMSANDLGGEPQVQVLTPGEAVRFRGSDFVFLGLQEGAARMRPEQHGDLECEEGGRPPANPAQEIRIPLENLYGSGGHLLLDIQHKRGC